VNRNPQAEQMAHESMIRCLKAQAEATWPQELPLLDRYPWPAEPEVLDVGCGIGEFTFRLAVHHPGARITGIDVIDEHLERARERCAAFGDRTRFAWGDAFRLAFADRSFDLTVCRHVLQSIPEPQEVLAEMVRVTRPGGRLHVVAEDYALMHFTLFGRDTDRFWLDGAVVYAESAGSDLRSGRAVGGHLQALGLADVRVDYIVIDTQRVPRPVFADIWRAWRDGYAAVIADHSALSREEVDACWEEMLRAIEDPAGYGVWHLPVWSGVVPG
jgi:SAM-dependent methyltransferase